MWPPQSIPRLGSHFKVALEVEPDYREALYALPAAFRSPRRNAEPSRQLVLYEKTDPTPRRHYADPLLDALDSIREDSVQEMVNEGHALQQSSDLDRTRAIHEDILDIDPQYPQAHVNLVAIHGQEGDFDRSGFRYERSVTMDPSIAEAHYNHGVSRHHAGKYSAAVEAFGKALDINPLHADSHSNSRTALEALGRGPKRLRTTGIRYSTVLRTRWRSSVSGGGWPTGDGTERRCLI